MIRSAAKPRDTFYSSVKEALAMKKDSIRVVVTGGRDYRDRAAVFLWLDRLDDLCPIAEVIHGGCSGADAFAADWAKARCVKATAYTAPCCKRHGKAAGPIRNELMLRVAKPDIMVAFPGHSGTKDCTRKANAAGIPIIYAAEEGPTIEPERKGKDWSRLCGGAK